MGKDLKTWENCLLFIEFAYNCSIHSSTSYTSFEIVCNFNPLTVLDHIPLSLHELTNLNGDKKVELVKSLQERARGNVEKKNNMYVDLSLIHI